jgi:hypothetical protein
MPLETDVAYACPYCDEQNYLGVDPTGGSRQTLIEDCPVCCSPIRFEIRVGPDGEAQIESSSAEA